MTWLIGKIIGNPTVLIVLLISTFVVGISTGGTAAWKIQGFRLESVKQEFAGYKLEQQRLFQEAKDYADKQRESSSVAYEAAQKALGDANQAHDTYKRCVAAGRCGVRVASCPAATVQASAGTNEASPDAIFATVESAETLANECAATTLQINHLQSAITRQKGY